MDSGSCSHIGHTGSIFTPLRQRFNLVGRPFMQAHQAKILIFSGILNAIFSSIKESFDPHLNILHILQFPPGLVQYNMHF